MDTEEQVNVKKKVPKKRKHRKVEKDDEVNTNISDENEKIREKNSKQRRKKKTPRVSKEEPPKKVVSNELNECEESIVFEHEDIDTPPNSSEIYTENGESTIVDTSTYDVQMINTDNGDETNEEPPCTKNNPMYSEMQRVNVNEELPESPFYDPLSEFSKNEESNEKEDLDDLMAFYCTDHDTSTIYPCGRVAVVVAKDENEATEILDDCLSNLRLKPSLDMPYTLIPIQRYGEPRAEIFKQVNGSRKMPSGPIINDTSEIKRLHVFASENHHCGDGMHLVSSYALILAYDSNHAIEVMDQFLNDKGWKTSKSHEYNIISFTSLKRPKAYVLNSHHV